MKQLNSQKFEVTRSMVNQLRTDTIALNCICSAVLLTVVSRINVPDGNAKCTVSAPAIAGNSCRLVDGRIKD